MILRHLKPPRLDTLASSFAIVIALILPPGVYTFVAFANLKSEIASQLHVTADDVVRVAVASPDGLASQAEHLKVAIQQHIRDHERDNTAMRVLDTRGNPIATAGPPLPAPVFVRIHDIVAAGQPVGRLEIQRSVRKLWVNASWLTLLGLALSAAFFAGLRVIPLRAMRRVNETLRRREASLAFANTVLTAATEGAPDAILIVKTDGTVVSFNERFLDIWQIPREALATGNDTSALALAAARVRNPDAFVGRVKYLYKHPDETSHDLIELADGRWLERHSRSLYAPDGGDIGRIWFFRDITDMKLAELKVQDELYRTQLQLQAIAMVSQSEGLISGDLEAVARLATELGARTVGCERVNVWLFNETETELRCIDLYERTPARHSGGMVLAEKEFGREIAIIKAAKYVDANDPLTDPRTAGYVEPYLKPLRITSMLDVSIEASGRHFGLLCFEHVDQPHVWTRDEIAFASHLADKIGLAAISRMRREAEAALRQRDALLHAVAVSAAELVSAPSLDEAVPDVLRRIGEAAKIDRISVLDRPPTRDTPPILRFVWQQPDVKSSLDTSFFRRPEFMMSEIAAWHASLSEGRIVTADRRTATGDLKKLFEAEDSQSLLLIPVSVDSRHWGHMGYESCRRERSWTAFEIEVLQLLTTLVGNAIQRERYVRELTNANRIVQNTPTILYRMRGEPSFPLSYISQNIRLLGHEPKALLASPNLYQSLVHPDDIGAVREAMAGVLEGDGEPGTIEFRVLTGAGEYRWMESHYSPVRDGAGRLIEIEGLMIDVTERKAADEKIAELARTDPLTGLANRTTFNDRLQQTFFAARRGASPFAVFYVDLDRFKDINDTLGHPVGDRLLVEIAERLKTNIRDTDLAARIGGDEFAVLQTALVNSTDAGTLATKMQSALAAPIVVAGNEIRITISVGIAIYAPDTPAPEDMLAQADVALYRAKEEGRNQYRFHTADLDRQVREDVTITEEIRVARERDEFELYYQPQLELSTNRIVGMEALLRWNHPRRGVLAPSAFVPIAERTGAIVQIGEWTLDRACRQMSEWRQAGIAPATIAVNVSPVQIKAANEFVGLVTETLAKWRLDPSALELDVTESMLARAALTHNDSLERLREAGVKIAIDDFGTRYSSIDYLRSYRVSRIKIPQPLLDQAVHDAEGAATVRAIIGIAREFGIDVVAQGVETEEQWSFLTATSPTSKVQGYYFSRPVPANDAGTLLKRGRLTPAKRAAAR